MIARAAALALAWAAMASTAAHGCAPPASPPADGRPRVGLVLSGGGARGLAHLGVLEVLEREHIAVDCIAGTSMGAIIGGLYASGLDAAALRRAFGELRWSELFAPRVERKHLPQRRKEEDFDVSPVFEFGVQGGELRAPLAAVSSRGLEALLRRHTLPVRAIDRFDRLPIPFRAVATDMETGAPVVLDHGDLAAAMRASMSVPGVFAPIELEGRLLGDGGLVDNTPIDVARAMGAEIVIVANIGTTLASRATLGSVVGLTTQMLTILTEQNVQRSLATMQPGDVLVAPALAGLTSADFDRLADFVERGRAGAQAVVEPLRRLALPGTTYAQWRARTAPPPTSQPTLAWVHVEGVRRGDVERVASQLDSRAGQAFDPARAERDVRELAATGDYARVDYRLQPGPDGDGLVIDVDEKPWGPDYLRIGLAMRTDFDGRSAFDLKLGHTRRWFTDAGGEWRNRAQIGASPQLATEVMLPLRWAQAARDDWFVAAYAGVDRRLSTIYAADGGDTQAQFQRTALRAGVDLGQPWGRWGEMRFGLDLRSARTGLLMRDARYGGPLLPSRYREGGLRLRAVVDQLDYVAFPQHGYRVELEAGLGRRSLGSGDDATRLEASATQVGTVDRLTMNLHARLQLATGDGPDAVGRYALGGFQQLSGYHSDQLIGNAVALGRIAWYLRLGEPGALTRGVFVGGSFEVGGAWAEPRRMRRDGLRSGFSLFVGTDTGVGPLYLGLTHAPRGADGIVLFVGRP